MDLTIRTMTAHDVAAGMRLKQRAGWNQVEADWRRLLELQPDGCFVAELDGAPIGTVTTCRFGAVGWVAMMLVDEAHRGRGIGRALMVRAIDDLERHGVQSIRLDATPLGRPLYESLGFATESVFVRFDGRFPPSTVDLGTGDAPPLANIEPVLALDRSVTGTDRGRLLRRLHEDQPGALSIVGDGNAPEGYVMSRPGASAWQVGPCIASARAGPRLFADAARRLPGERVFIDIPECHVDAANVACAFGLGPSRHLTRMGRGPRVVEDLALLWASAGPEKG